MKSFLQVYPVPRKSTLKQGGGGLSEAMYGQGERYPLSTGWYLLIL